MKIPNDMKKYFITPSDCPKYNINNPDYRCMVDEKQITEKIKHMFKVV